MKTFEFVAFDSSGKRREGKINAWRLSEAKRKIQKSGLYLASIRIQDGSVRSGINSQNPFSLFRGLKRLFFSDTKVGI
jgi:type II secretory pathway component PulF